MRTAPLVSSSSSMLHSYLETVDSTTMTHGTDGAKVPAYGFSSISPTFGSLADTTFRGSTILAVRTGVSILRVILSGNQSQEYFDRIVCTLGTFNQSAATWSYDGANNRTTWQWGAPSDFAPSGTSTVEIIY